MFTISCAAENVLRDVIAHHWSTAPAEVTANVVQDCYIVLETSPVMLSPLALAAINDGTLAVKLLIDLAGELTAATRIAREAEGR